MYVKPNLEVKYLKQALKTTKAVLELKEADLVRMAEDLAITENQLEFSKKREQEVREAYHELESAHRNVLDAYSKSIDEVKGLQAQRDLITKQNLELRKKNAELAGRCDCSTLRGKVIALTRIKVDLKEQNAAQADQLDLTKKRIKELETQLIELDNRLNNLTSSREGIKELEISFVPLNECQLAVAKTARLEKNIEVLLKQKSELQASNRAFVSGNKALRKRVVELATELSELEITCGSRLQQIEELRAQLDNVMWANEKHAQNEVRWSQLIEHIGKQLEESKYA